MTLYGKGNYDGFSSYQGETRSDGLYHICVYVCSGCYYCPLLHYVLYITFKRPSADDREDGMERSY